MLARLNCKSVWLKNGTAKQHFGGSFRYRIFNTVSGTVYLRGGRDHV
jgi:hypothetical protein